MLKIIAHQNVELSKEEWEYYQEIEKAFGQNAFLGLFEVNKDGAITLVKPSAGKPTSAILIFFLLNVQFNQKLRALSDGLISIKDLETKVKILEEKLKER